MKRGSFSKKRIIHISIISFIIIMIILIAVLLMYKYNVEGETNMPFIITKMNIVSTAGTDFNQNEDGTWRAEILQTNNISFLIEKNSNYKKGDVIKRVSFENFQINKTNEDMIVSIYRPTTSIATYDYIDEYKVDGSLEYVGGQSTNTATLQINNQGAVIGFSVVSDNVGEYTFEENEKVASDGTLLAKAGINSEDINFKISFDLIIETESEHKFKANVVLDLPTGNILENGVGTLEDTELENVIFKRF